MTSVGMHGTKTATLPEVWLKVKNEKVQLAAGRLREDLDESPTVVTVQGGDDARPPLLDGRRLVILQRNPLTAVGELSLVNDAGCHEVSVWRPGRAVPEVFAFLTKTAARRARMVRRMVDCVAELGKVPRDLVLQGTFGPRPDRVPGVILGWLSERLPAVLEAASAILKRPVPDSTVRRQVRSYAKHMDLPATLTLLRARRELLSRRDDGALEVFGARYTPEFVVDQEAVRTMDTLEHRQLADFLGWLSRDIVWLRTNNRLASYTDTALRWLAELGSMGRHPVLREVKVVNVTASRRAAVTALQRQDWRYRALRVAFAEYQGLRSYLPADDDLRSFLEAADKVFEAFCCHVIARAFDLSPCGRTLRDRVGLRSFSRGDDALYYDVKPPAELLTSWRDGTACEDRDRPDILLRVGGKLALLDCKFKDYASGGDLTSDVQEMQAYQNSYGLKRSALLCPFGRGVVDIAGRGHLIRVIPVRPPQNTEKIAQLLDYIRSSLDSVFDHTSG